MFIHDAGNYGDGSIIYLDNNHLKTFDAGVFKTILQQMSSSGGHIEVQNSKLYTIILLHSA